VAKKVGGAAEEALPTERFGKNKGKN